MPNILTAAEAASAIRVASSDADLVALLPMVDAFVNKATGRDWTQDTAINVLAKNAARMLIVQWYDNPSMLAQAGEGTMPLSFGLINTLSQLETEALKYRKYQFEGLDGAGDISLPGARVGDDVIKLVGVYGVSGSQVSKFETEISDDDYIAQTDSGDLSDNLYVVVLKSPADDVGT